MAKPIKDRGIHWQEAYGEKSSYLKSEMEEQIGPGSYFRWEGHDFTTGNDYYVVVSPGYSPSYGYHFFAGLRKMPAYHGASGKEFNSMREAMNYAYDTWRVPRPTGIQPGGIAYTIEHIKDKDIVLKGVHASSERTVKVADLIEGIERMASRLEAVGRGEEAKSARVAAIGLKKRKSGAS